MVAASQAESPKRERHWYGAPILLGDGAAYASLLVAIAAQSKTTNIVFIPPAVLGYALVGPVTHALHGNWGWTVMSLGMRGVLPIAGALVGVSATNGCSARGSCLDAAAAGLAMGALAATVLDAALLAREDRPVTPRRAAIQPLLELAEGHALLGASGTF